ncbi:hypothetical protein MNBD_NITROSPINAE01-1926 [hydrothermal vent metagenome]|uniref:Glycosyltransferase n=1 Tax=hydrothermal vent metagenome TaxID=652676 RepID=A0A3B1CNB5_9ZZZZ
MFGAEQVLLSDNGHDVVEYMRNNLEIESYPLYKKALLFKTTTWSKKSYKEVRALCLRQKPDVAHFHNTLPLVTPSAYYACRDEGIPVVQTLHNYRLICPGALLMHNAQVCEKCIDGSYRHAIRNKCYRDSRIQTWTVARMLKYHRKIATWKNIVNRYIALNEFSKRKYVEGGLPEYKISVKPNFAYDLKKIGGDHGFAIYLGRLSQEKGVSVLLDAMRGLPGFPLKIIGDGPDKELLESKNSNYNNIEFSGKLGHDEVMGAIEKCSFIVVPSLWYENFPMTIVEAFSCGKPVIVSRIGALEGIIEDGKTGLHFEPGNARDLAKKIEWMVDNPLERKRMGENARRVYKEKYTPERSYEMLMDIYSQAISDVKNNA